MRHTGASQIIFGRRAQEEAGSGSQPQFLQCFEFCARAVWQVGQQCCGRPAATTLRGRRRIADSRWTALGAGCQPQTIQRESPGSSGKSQCAQTRSFFCRACIARCAFSACKVRRPSRKEGLRSGSHPQIIHIFSKGGTQTSQVGQTSSVFTRRGAGETLSVALCTRWRKAALILARAGRSHPQQKHCSDQSGRRISQ